MSETKINKKIKVILSALAICVVLFAIYVYYEIESSKINTVREEQEIR